jgi:hypothetical protein
MERRPRCDRQGSEIESFTPNAVREKRVYETHSFATAGQISEYPNIDLRRCRSYQAELMTALHRSRRNCVGVCCLGA